MARVTAAFDAVVCPDGRTEVPFMAHDTFFPALRDSIGLGCVIRDSRPRLSLFSLHARPGERFLGTGERFSRFGLAGSTVVLENTDALGVSSRRAYKNVPFYVSSAGYGLFIHMSNRARLSFADISSRAVQGGVESSVLDLFFIGGGSIPPIVAAYRRLTGIPKLPALWTYGVWISRMSYFSAKEALEERIGDLIGRELRAYGGTLFGGVCIILLRHPAWGRAQETHGEDPCLLGVRWAPPSRGAYRGTPRPA
jgi:alpha-D-xyloside xylohydrolase